MGVLWNPGCCAVNEPVVQRWIALIGGTDRLLILVVAMAGPVAAHECRQAGLAVQILGSGGPIADDDRAGSSALIWINGHARVLVDAGGGAFLRFGQAGARIEDLELIALTHFHADHAVDLPALLQSATFSDRARELIISGPSGGGGFPGLDGFMNALFDPEQGAFRYLAEPGFELNRRTVMEAATEPVVVLDQADLRVDAVGVPHGTVPALAYRVEAGEHVIIFSGDQNGLEAHFWRFADEADLLVMNHVVAEQFGPRALSRHAPPSVIGRGAAEAGVRRLLLTHRMRRSGSPEAAQRIIAESFDGQIQFADDLMCLPVEHSPAVK